MKETQETWVGFLIRKILWRRKMATHSSIFARRTPWTEKPGGLQSMESQSQTWVNMYACMHTICTHLWGFPGGSDGKEFACNAGDLDLIPVSVRSSGEGNGNPLQYFCLEKPMDRGAWRATVHGVAKNQKCKSNHAHSYKMPLIYWLLSMMILKLWFSTKKNITS